MQETIDGQWTMKTVEVTFPAATFEALLRRAIVDGATADEAADTVLAPYEGLPITALARPAVLKAAENEARRQVKLAERKAMFPPEASDDDFRRRITETLLTKGFTVGGVMVNWGQATVAQHRARILWYQVQIAGMAKTIREHQMAIALIEAAGATCLAEVPDLHRRIAEIQGDEQASA